MLGGHPGFRATSVASKCWRHAHLHGDLGGAFPKNYSLRFVPELEGPATWSRLLSHLQRLSEADASLWALPLVP